MRARILFTIPNFITAGSGAAMLNIIQRLDRDQFEPAVCVSRKGGRLDREVERMGIPFLEAPFTVPALPYTTLLTRAWRAAGVFRPHRFELWHSFHYSDDYTEPIIARLAGARRWVFTKKNMMWGQRAWYLRTLFASRVAAQNTEMLDAFFRFPLFRYKTRLIPRGVDLIRFRPGMEPRLRLRERLGLEGRIVVGNVGHIVPVKGHSTLFEAMAQLPDLILLIAGKPIDAKYFAVLREQVARLGIENRVHFLGDVDDVPAFLAEIDIFCFPTRMEGCGVALLEAMASGLACIASDTGGPRDLIQHQQSGWLVPRDDVNALRLALEQVSREQLRDRLGRAARTRVEEHYSIEQEVAAHTALYQEIRGADEP